MIPRRSLAACAALTGVALALSGCTGSGNVAENNPGLSADLDNLATTTPAGTLPVEELAWNLPYEPLSLDPMHSFNYAENTVIANLCESLLRMTPELGTEPGLAESVANPDDRTYVYTIREGVTFWDGSPLTADDVAYSLSRQAGDETTSYFGEYFRNVASVAVTGEREVTVTLSSPDALFAGAMASAAGAIVQRAAAESAGEAFGTPDGGLQCTGPFSLESWNSGKSITLAKNPAYWDAELTPLVERISFSFIADESTAVNALNSGDVDGQFFYLPPAGLTQLENSDAVSTVYGKSLVFWALVGTADDGPFADPLVRQAVSAAVDRQALADVVFQGAAIPAPTLAGPAYWGYEEQAFESAFEGLASTLDPARAKELVAEAGNPTDTIVIGVQGSSAVHEQTANLIQAAGAAIGLSIETKVIPVEQFGNLYSDPQAREGLDGFFTTFYGNFADPLDVYQVFRSGGVSNFGNWEGADDLLVEAIATSDEAERAELTIQAQKVITEELPWIPLTYEPTTLVQSTRISGAPASFAYLYYPWAATIGGVE